MIFSRVGPLTPALELLADGDSVSPSAVALLRLPAVEALMAARSGAGHATAALNAGFGTQCEQHEPPEGNSTQAAQLWLDMEQFTVTARVLPEASEQDVVEQYGRILSQCPRLPRSVAKIARQCADGTIGTLDALHLKLERATSAAIYLWLLALLAAALAALWLMAH